MVDQYPRPPSWQPSGRPAIQLRVDLDITASVEMSLVWVPVALVFLALASVFRRGEELSDDVELTV